MTPRGAGNSPYTERMEDTKHSAGLGCICHFELAHISVAFTQLVLGAAKRSVESMVPIPVLLEPTRSLFRNLLTRRTVLGQPHCGSNEASRYSMRNPANCDFLCVMEEIQSATLERRARILPKPYFVRFFQPLRQSFQSSSVALHISLAALCSHRPFRLAKSRLISGIPCGEPKCILAVSHPIEYSSLASSRSAVNETSSIREQSGASRRTTHRS